MSRPRGACFFCWLVFVGRTTYGRILRCKDCGSRVTLSSRQGRT